MDERGVVSNTTVTLSVNTIRTTTGSSTSISTKLLWWASRRPRSADRERDKPLCCPDSILNAPAAWPPCLKDGRTADTTEHGALEIHVERAPPRRSRRRSHNRCIASRSSMAARRPLLPGLGVPRDRWSAETRRFRTEGRRRPDALGLRSWCVARMHSPFTERELFITVKSPLAAHKVLTCAVK